MWEMRTNKPETWPEHIWLLPETEDDGGATWSTTPDPIDGLSPIEYIRIDKVLSLIDSISLRRRPPTLTTNRFSENTPVSTQALKGAGDG